MKKYNKIMAAVLCVAMSIGLLTGCGQKPAEETKVQESTESEAEVTETTEAEATGQVEVSIGGWPLTNDQWIASWAKKKEKFETANPDVKIIEDGFAFDIKTFAAKAAAGELPDYFSFAYTAISEVIGAGYAADLKEGLDKYGYTEKYNQQVLDLVSGENGEIYAMPSTTYVLGLLFNADLMEQAGLMEEDGTPMQPKTWEEVAEFAVKIKEATGKPGFLLPTSGNTGGWMLSPIAWSYGVDFMEKDENGKWIATFDSEEMVKCVQFVKDLKWKYDVLPDNNLIDYSGMFETYATGGAGMMIAAGDFANDVVKYEPDLEMLGIMAMPAGPERHVTLLGGGVRAVGEGATAEQIDAIIRWHSQDYSPELTDDTKASIENKIQKDVEAGKLIGVKQMSPWNEKSDAYTYEVERRAELANANPNHIKLYNDFVTDCPAEIQAEEPVCAQELYSILDEVIQQVIMDENADCQAIVSDAAARFQSDYLDNVDY